ncbi:MAG: RNA methyltransferase [Cyanobacteriota bacterium]|jgi:tRNA/rRNA methyltransferase
MNLQVVLVEPAGPLNVGSVARLCANFGIEGLRLVAPRCDPLGEEARRMAVHGLPLLERAVTFPSLSAALADCRRVVATSGRQEGEPLPLCEPQEALGWLLEGEDNDAPAAIVFGREDRGLGNDELLQAGRLLQIATGPAYASLNLSHAVAVVLHELQGLRSLAAPQTAEPAPRAAARPAAAAEPCPRGALEGALADAEALLLEVGFLYPHTAHARMAKLRALLQRAEVSSAEVALLRGMVCQLRWASRRAAPPLQDH